MKGHYSKHFQGKYAVVKHIAYDGFLFRLMWKFLDNLFVDIVQHLIIFLYLLC